MKRTMLMSKLSAVALSAYLSGILFLALSAAAGPIRIQQVEPTPFFPKPAVAEPLRQQARLCLENSGPP
ncbi:MAG: hypothetical protein NT154_11840, partial [Verrucomicrobia bacterium]|nr:hypothetical protein [Verrucomicrobiota bacterium]